MGGSLALNLVLGLAMRFLEITFVEDDPSLNGCLFEVDASAPKLSQALTSHKEKPLSRFILQLLTGLW